MEKRVPASNVTGAADDTFAAMAGADEAVRRSGVTASPPGTFSWSIRTCGAAGRTAAAGLARGSASAVPSATAQATMRLATKRARRQANVDGWSRMTLSISFDTLARNP